MLSTVSQIRNYGYERNQDKSKTTDHEPRLRQAMKEYKETKSPEAKAKVRSIWTMAGMQGVNIDPKLNDQVKKLLREPDVKPSAAGSGDGAASEGPGMGNLLGGLAENFTGGASGGGGAIQAEPEAGAVQAADEGSAVSSGDEAAAAQAADGGSAGGSAAQAADGASASPSGDEGGAAQATDGGSAVQSGDEAGAAQAAEGASAHPSGPAAQTDEAGGGLATEQTAKTEDAVKEINANDPFGESRTALTSAFRDSNVLNDQSMERLGNMMSEFENRMAGLAMTKIDAYRTANGSITPEKAQEILAEQRQKIEDTYRHLTEMVGTKQGSAELFNQADRTSMSENLLFHLADPRTFDQGSNGTCWINSSTASYGLTNQPDDMARFMKEISLTGQFNAHPDGTGNGARTVQFNKNMFYATGEERNWKISSALGGSARSPVGMFMDEAMTEMVGKHRADAGDYYGSWGARRIMTMISGEPPPEPRGRLWSASVNRQMGQGDMQTMLQYGGFQTYSPGHLQSVQFVPEHKTSWNGASGLTYNGQNLKLDGTDKFSGYVVLDNQWGERSDYVTHYMNDARQVMDIQDQRYKHFDPGKVDNERQITIRPGNDSNGGGGGGDWDGGGLVPILPSVLDNVIGGGGIADKSDLTTPGGWQSLLKSLTVLAEKEVSRGRPGKNYQLLKKVVGETKVAEVVDAGTINRMKKVLQKGRMLETRFRPLPRPRMPR